MSGMSSSTVLEELEQCLRFEQVAHACTEWELTQAKKLDEEQQTLLREMQWQIANVETDLCLSQWACLQQRVASGMSAIRAAQLQIQAEALAQQLQGLSAENAAEVDQLQECLRMAQKKYQEEKEAKRQLRAHCRELKNELEQERENTSAKEPVASGRKPNPKSKNSGTKRVAEEPSFTPFEDAPVATEEGYQEEEDMRAETSVLKEQFNARAANTMNLTLVRNDARSAPKTKRRRKLFNASTASALQQGPISGAQKSAAQQSTSTGSIFGGGLMAGLRNLGSGALAMPKLKGSMR